MKKILLTIALFGVVLLGKSQTVMNELYSDPGNGHQEFFELYNSSTNPIAENLDCYTMVVFYKSGTTTGFNVLDFPNVSVGPKSFMVGASADPFNVQSQTGLHANFNWSALDPSGSLMFYQKSGTGYAAPVALANTNDFLKINTGTPASLAVFLFKNGGLVNAFMGGMNNSAVPADITGMPDLNVTMSGCAGFTIHWANITFAENTTANGGSDNGYARSNDGICGSWVKTSASVQHTPGVTNGSGVGLTGSLTTSPEIIKCRVAPSTGRVIFQITGFTGSVSLAADFPVEVQVYADYDATLTQGAGNGQLDQYDTIKGVKSLANINIVDSVDFSPSRQPLIIVYKTKRGCFDKVVAVPNPCAALPVNFTYFTAKRNSSSAVNLAWQTSFELNNSGFAIERAIGNGSWEQIAFIPSQAAASLGNSENALSYQYVDMNSTKGISQYRIRQIDLNGKYYFTDIRAVRGIDQVGKTIVYPNPSSDGKVNVVFEDASAIRDVSLIDMSGRIIKQWNGISNNNLQVTNLVPGLYSLRIVVRETGAQSVEKIVVNNR